MFASSEFFRIRGRGGEGKDKKVLASSEAFLSLSSSVFSRTVREGSSAPLPRLRMTSAFLL